MANKTPIVLDSNAQMQQLQQGDELNIPLEQRVQELTDDIALLVQTLTAHSIELPGELTDKYL